MYRVLGRTSVARMGKWSDTWLRWGSVAHQLATISHRKKADRWIIDAFELWCWRRLLRVPWIARRTNLSILKEINPECSLEGQILKLRLQYFGHLMRREDSLEKTLILGKVWRQEEKGMTVDEMAGQCHWSHRYEFDPTPGGSGRQEGLACSGPWVTKSQTWLND